MKLFVILLFAATYVAMIALPKWRYLVALGSAAIMIVSGALPVTEAFGQIDWNVLMMLAGTMGTVSLFIASKMPERMADLLLKKTPNILWVAVALSVFAGLISAFVDNVATVLMVAPVALAIATKLGTSPIPLLICKKSSERAKNAFKEIDFETILLLAGLFIVIGSLTYNGIIDDISQLLVNLGGSNLFLMYSLIVWASVLFSAFIDNIPYVATMLPVVAGIAARMGCDARLLYFGLLVGATLGGNLTPIGASANIAAIGILRKAGYEVKTSEFLRIGVPFTLIAVLAGYLFCWFVWA